MSSLKPSRGNPPVLNINLHPRQSLVYQSTASEILYGGAAGGGKAAQVQTEVPTPTGWTTMGDLEVGDQVLDEKGNPTFVVAVSEVQHDRPCYRVTFDDGNSLVVDGSHSWLTDDETSRNTKAKLLKKEKFLKLGLTTKGKKKLEKPQYSRDQTHKLKKPEVRTTEQIKDTLWAREGRLNHSIDLGGALKLDKKKLPIPAYLLGVWLGDGCKHTGVLYFPKEDARIVEKIGELGYPLQRVKDSNNRGTCQVWTISGGFKQKLKKHGFLHNKYIPRQYLRASYDQRLELLRGLMDTDGTCLTDGKCSFSNINRDLIDGVYELLLTLGIKPYIRKHHSEKRNDKLGYYQHDAWEVCFTTSIRVFHLERKYKRQVKKERLTQERRYIVSVEQVPSVPVKCIQVSNASHLFLIGRGFIPTHNSFCLRALSIIWACQVPGIQIYLFRRTFPDLERNHINGPTAYPILLAEFLRGGWVTWDKQKYVFRFWNGSAIHLCHCQRESDRFNYQGAEFHVLLLDELGQFTAVIYRYLRGRVRKAGLVVPDGVVGTFPKIVAGSNPGGPCHNFNKMTWIDPAPSMVIWRAKDTDGGMLRQFIPARLDDNPTLFKEDPDYMNRLRGLGDPQLVKAMLEGDFTIVSGGMFDDLWSEGVHVLQPFKIPRSFYFDRAFDMGTSKPFAVGWYAESDGSSIEMANGLWTPPRGTLFQIGEWYGWNGEPDVGIRLDPSAIARGIVEREQAYYERTKIKFNPGPADTSIWDADEYGKAVVNDFEKAGVRWVKANKSPGTRVAGARRIRAMLNASLVHPMEDPGLFIFSNCRNTIRILPVATRSQTNVEDVSGDFEDHIVDMKRYRVLSTQMVAKPRDDIRVI